MKSQFNPPLQVVGFVGSRRGETDRGPAIWLRSDDAEMRGVADGDLVWIYGPRRHDLAPVAIDDTLPRAGTYKTGAPFRPRRAAKKQPAKRQKS